MAMPEIKKEKQQSIPFNGVYNAVECLHRGRQTKRENLNPSLLHLRRLHLFPHLFILPKLHGVLLMQEQQVQRK